MVSKAKRRRRAIEREKRRFAYELEHDPRALRRFFDKLVEQGHTTSHEINECLRRMDAADGDAAETEIKTRFIKTLMERVEAAGED